MILDKIIRLLKANFNSARRTAEDSYKKFEEFEAKFAEQEKERKAQQEQQARQQRQQQQQYNQQRQQHTHQQQQQQNQQQRQSTPPPSAAEKEKSYYDALELPLGADFEQIKSAYKKQMKRYHPDRFHNEPAKQKIAEQVSKKINEAYSYFEQKYKK
jgi:hypothetical protein